MLCDMALVVRANLMLHIALIDARFAWVCYVEVKM